MKDVIVKRSPITVAVETTAILAVLVVCGLAIPLLLQGSTSTFVQFNQFLVGPLVNCALIIAAIRFKRWYSALGIVCVPSVLAIAGGLVFALGNVFMLFMIPFIWLGNLALVMIFRYSPFRKGGARRAGVFIITAPIAICAKAALIFGGFLILFFTGAITGGPAAVMWNAMGLYQVITAVAGSVLAFGVLFCYGRRKRLPKQAT